MYQARAGSVREKEFFIDNLLVRIHRFLGVTGLAPWEFESPLVMLLKVIPEQRCRQPETGRSRGTFVKKLGASKVADLASSGDFEVDASTIYF